jgi:hypothetical protein
MAGAGTLHEGHHLLHPVLTGDALLVLHECLEPPETAAAADKPKKLVIICYSGELEKTWATMILASTAGAREMETTVFVTA